MEKPVDWTLWRSFLAVADTGSLSAAARRLGLTQPTLGRHIEALETAIGQPLFLRAPHGMMPTPAAQALMPEAQTMAHAAASLERRAASSGEFRGTVRIAASHVVGAEVLPRLLAPLLDQHPGLAIELDLSNDPADLGRHAADLAIRMTRPGQSSLIARKLADVRLGLFCACRLSGPSRHAHRPGRPGCPCPDRPRPQHRRAGRAGRHAAWPQRPAAAQRFRSGADCLGPRGPWYRRSATGHRRP